MKLKPAIRPILAALGTATIAISSATAQTDGTWNQPTTGTYDWTDTGNWLNGTVAGGTGATATFNVTPSGNQTIDLDDDVTLGSLVLSWTNRNLTIQSPDEEVLTFAVASGTPLIQTANARMIRITSTIAGTQGLEITGGGTSGGVALAGANTFTGGIHLNGGSLGINNNTTTTDGLNGNKITVSGTSYGAFTGGTDITGGMHINEGAEFNAGTNNNTYTISGVLSGSGVLSHRQVGAGNNTITLSNTANTFTGRMDYSMTRGTIFRVSSLGDAEGAGNIRMGIGGNFTRNDSHHRFIFRDANADLVLTNRQFEFHNSSALADFWIEAAGGTHKLVINSDVVNSHTGSAMWLRLAGSSTADNTFGGKITDGTGNVDGPSALSLRKTDGGKWILSGANTFTGNISLEGGRLEIGGSGTLGNVSAGVGNYAGNISISSSNSGRLVYNSSASQTLSGVISGAGQLFVEDGTLTLTNDNEYTGATTVNSGTLIVNGDASVATGNVTVETNGILGGTGTVGGNTTITGFLSPGNSPGTLTFASNLTVGDGATYLFDAEDLTIVNNTLDLDNSAWTLTLGSGFQDGGSITIFEYGTLASSPNLNPTFDITNLGFTPSGTLSLTDTGSGEIILQGVSLIPEPGAALLGGIGLLLLLRRRR